MNPVDVIGCAGTDLPAETLAILRNADLIAGLTLGVRCGRLICKTCVLTDIREVN